MPFGIAPSCAEAAPARDTASRHKPTAFIFIGLFFLLGELTSDAGREFRRLRPRVLWVSRIAGLLLNGETSGKSGAGGGVRGGGSPRIVLRASRYGGRRLPDARRWDAECAEAYATERRWTVSRCGRRGS